MLMQEKTDTKQESTSEIPPDFDIAAAISKDNKTMLIRLDNIEGGLSKGEQVIVWVGLSPNGTVYAGGAKHIGYSDGD